MEEELEAGRQQITVFLLLFRDEDGEDFVEMEGEQSLLNWFRLQLEKGTRTVVFQKPR